MKTIIKNNTLKKFGIILFVVIFTACSGINSPSNIERTIALKIQSKVATTPKAKISYSKSAQADSITLLKVKILVDEFELKSATNDSLDFEINDFVVDLPLDGSPLIVTSEVIPEGIYDEVEFEVDDADDDSDVDDQDMVEGTEDSLRYSIVIEGIYNGTPFTYKSQAEFEQELELNPPLEISATSTSVAIKLLIDTSNWFIDKNTNAILDPNDPENSEKIDENIENSFDVDEQNEQEEQEEQEGQNGEND